MGLVTSIFSNNQPVNLGSHEIVKRGDDARKFSGQVRQVLATIEQSLMSMVSLCLKYIFAHMLVFCIGV